MSQEEVQEKAQELQDAIDRMADSFQDIENIVRGMGSENKLKYLNPESLGYISSFLEIGNGYEPAFPGSRFHSCSDLMDDYKDYLEKEYGNEPEEVTED